VPSASHSVTINRPASEVFAFVADGENAPRWRSGVLDIQRVSGQGVRAVYPAGRPWSRRAPRRRRLPGHGLPAGHAAGVRDHRGTGAPHWRVPPARGRRRHDADAVAAGRPCGREGAVHVRLVQKTMDAEVAAIDNVKRLLEP
jgi:hypothetical protein